MITGVAMLQQNDRSRINRSGGLVSSGRAGGLRRETAEGAVQRGLRRRQPGALVRQPPLMQGNVLRCLSEHAADFVWLRSAATSAGGNDTPRIEGIRELRLR